MAVGSRKKPPLTSRLADACAGGINRVRDAWEILFDPAGARLLHEFADVVTVARQPEEVEQALVRFAGVVGDASRVELLLDRDVTASPDPKRMALWPEGAEAMTADEVEALGYPLCLGLWCGDHYQMTLQVFAKPGRGSRWPARVVRRLTTLAAMAAAAERGMHAGRRARHEAPAEGEATVRDATFLSAILPYALSQAARHREPLTLFCVEIDGLPTLTEEHGQERIDGAVHRVALAIAGTLRGSDVVTRLDDDRIVVVLPNTGAGDAMTVAKVVRSAMTAACLPVGVMPELTASIGVASFPEDGREMTAILAVADEAMIRARRLGRNQCVQATPPLAKPHAPAPAAVRQPAREEVR